MGSIVSSENEGPSEALTASEGLNKALAKQFLRLGPPPKVEESEPPLTPEEEEEAPEDSRCVFCWHSESQHNLLAQTCTVDGEASRCGCERFRAEPEDEDACNHLCECGHEQGDHSSSGHCKQCDCESSTGHYVTDCPEHVCETYYCPTAGEVESACHGGFDVCCGAPEKHLPADQAPKPPQPERRAPYVATYSVGGHLYEVAVPGDACLQAVDGALVIRHGLGPVAGLVGFQPLTLEGKR